MNKSYLIEYLFCLGVDIQKLLLPLEILINNEIQLRR